MQTVKIIEDTNYTYIIEVAPTKYWRVIRITNSSPYHFMVADVKGNPTTTIDQALTNYQSLVYNEIYE